VVLLLHVANSLTQQLLQQQQGLMILGCQG
jgi:hypothetical protein